MVGGIQVQRGDGCGRTDDAGELEQCRGAGAVVVGPGSPLSCTAQPLLNKRAAGLASVLDPPFGLSLGGWNACRTLQDNIMLNNKLSQLSRG